jgi:hypothetical protein
MEKGPQMPTPAEMAEFEKKRILSDAELIKGGADIEVDEKGNRINLLATEAQKEKIEKDGLMTEKEEAEKRIAEIIRKERIKPGDKITIEVKKNIFSVPKGGMSGDYENVNVVGARFRDSWPNGIEVESWTNKYFVSCEEIVKLEKRD